jgi:adenylate cyclase
MRLSSRRLAQWIGVADERIERLIALGLISSGSDGRFAGEDVHTARLVLAMEDAGIAPDVVAEAAAGGVSGLDTYPDWFPSKPINPGRPYGEFVEDVGVDADRLRSVYRMVGLPEPDPGRRIAEDEQSMIWQLLDLADAVESVELLRRALTAFSVAAMTAVERSVALYAEQAETVRQGNGGILAEAETTETWSRLSRLSPHLLAWLCRRHLEAALDSLTVVRTERYLADRGYTRVADDEPQAVVFVDISGYTSLTEAEGDHMGALLGAGIGDLAASTAEGHSGRLIKLLGDGAMLVFPKMQSAVAAALDMVAEAGAAGMPPLHVGIDAGPMVYRDGDFYGHTVNVAARLAAVAPSGVIYAPAHAAARAEGDWEPVGSVTLKGISMPIEVCARSGR